MNANALERTRFFLTISAIALACFCGLCLISLTSTPAAAEMVATIPGELVALTADSGSEEVLVVLDNRTERVMVYRLTPKGLELFASEGLRELFGRARAMSPQ